VGFEAPVILSKEEIEELVMATKNINHRLIIGF